MRSSIFLIFFSLAAESQSLRQIPNLTSVDNSAIGASVAVDGTGAVIGAPSEQGDPGAVYVYDMGQLQSPDRPVPTKTIKLIPSDPTQGMRFGESVAIFSARVIVGAPSKITFVPSTQSRGGAYIFEKSGGRFIQRAALELPGSMRGAESVRFGHSVAISGDFAAIGVPDLKIKEKEKAGAVFIYRKISSKWTHHQTISQSNSQVNAQFGYSVAMRGNSLVVGEPGRGADSGGASIYEFDARSTGATAQLWVKVKEITPIERIGERLGHAVSISQSGKKIAVGAPQVSLSSNNFHARPGYVIMYGRTSTSSTKWLTGLKVVAGDCYGTCSPGAKNSFGWSVAVDDESLIVGAVPQSYGDTLANVFVHESNKNKTQISSGVAAATPLFRGGFSVGSAAISFSGHRGLIGFIGCGDSRFGGCVFHMTLRIPFLAFPLKDFTAYNAPINSVMDHSVTSNRGDDAQYFYLNDADRVVVGYSGEEGRLECGRIQCQLSAKDPSYRKRFDAEVEEFVVNGNYTGGGYPKFLSYNGHPGFDYRASLGTSIYAPADGIAYIPSEDPVTSKTASAAAPERFGALAIDHQNGYTSWFLHVGDRDKSGDAGDFRVIRCGDGTQERRLRPGSLVSVKKGCQIGKVGNKGLGPDLEAHLHYEVRVGAYFDLNGNGICEAGVCVPVDPYGWDPFASSPVKTDVYAPATSLPLWDHTK